MSSQETPLAEQSFEEATRRLADIVAQLESGDLPLEKSLALFEEGVRLARAAQTRLDLAEKRVEELLAIDAQGKPILRPFEG
jgi:exodeoxyribonuclease VII small subunit